MTAASSSAKPPLPFGEFIALISMMSALGALSTDAIIPALPHLGAALGVTDANQRQLTISTFFLGLAFGQLFYGPLADSRGRKPAIFLGLGIFLLGGLLSYFAQDFQVLLLGRAVQGLGLAATRTIPMALVRDQFVGNRMAQVMSFTQTVFILVPMLAPSYGQLVMNIGGWRSIFLSLMVVGMAVLVWFAVRQPETLTPEKRTPFHWSTLTHTLKVLLKQPQVMLYTVMAGLISGAFMGYLNSAQQLYQDLYKLGTNFSLYFALVALSLGAASLLNSQLVMRLGMQRISQSALWGVLLLAIGGLGASWLTGGTLPLWGFIVYLMCSFFGVGLLFGNLNALAMQPLGRNAGVGASVVGAVSSLLSVPIGTVIGLSYNHTTIPLMLGLGSMAGLCLLLSWLKRTVDTQVPSSAS